MQKNNRTNNEELLLKEVPTKLRNARSVTKNVPYELHDFCDYLADVAKENLNPMEMMILLFTALDDLKKERCGFTKKIEFPEQLKIEKIQIISYLSFFPLIIDKITSKEFAEEFRGLFTQYLGEAQPPVKENKENFGVIIIGKDQVDISNKDKAEVLAALYNNSHPQGMGFLHYNPENMSVEEARKLLEETQVFDYLQGRVLKINLSGTILNTWLYNRDNGDNAAETVISQCKNIK
jgi:hypothetical protein